MNKYGALILSIVICTLEIPLGSRAIASVDAPGMSRVVGDWRAEIIQVQKPGVSPPELDDMICKVSSRNITLTVSEKGEMSIRPYVDRMESAGEADLNPSELKYMDLDKNIFRSIYVAGSIFEKRYSNVDYTGRLYAPSSGRGYILLQNKSTIFPINGILYKLLDSSTIVTVFYDSRVDKDVSYRSTTSGVKALLGWCFSKFKDPSSRVYLTK